MRVRALRDRCVRTAAAVGAAAALLLAVGCASDGPPARCPEIAVPQDAERITQFREGGRDLTDVRFDAQIVDVALACEVDEDDGKRTVLAEVGVLFRAEKGPANQSGRAELSYFVGIADADGAVVARESFEVALAMPGNRNVVRGQDRVSPTIPLPEDTPPTAYTVYVGFDLTRAQYEYNRRNR